MKKLQSEGLFSFKNVPQAKQQDKNRRASRPFTSSDAAYDKLPIQASFQEVPSSPPPMQK